MRSTRRKSAMSAKPNRESLRLNIAPIHDDGLISNYGYEYTVSNFGRTVRLLRCAGFASADSTRKDAKRQQDEITKAVPAVNRYLQNGVSDIPIWTFNQKEANNVTPE